MPADFEDWWDQYNKAIEFLIIFFSYEELAEQL
jgi:hypothetical protein